MILRSNKLVIKKPKQSDEINEDDDDIISKLPNELLIRILCLLPDADANGTRILSNRWKPLYAFLPNLHFNLLNRQINHQYINYYNLFDQTLAIRGDMPIQRLFLKCSNNCDYNRVYGWLSTCCRDLFKSCNTLVALTLEGDLELIVPETELLLPCLKKINLLYIKYRGDQSQSLVNLILGCPVLEELCLDAQKFFVDAVMVKISSLSLKKLTISQCLFKDCAVVIDAPKLEYIYIKDNWETNYSLMNQSSLVEAHINKLWDFGLQLIRSVSSAKMLTLTYESLGALVRDDGLNLPMFPNLVELVIPWGDNILPVLLNNMPNLEHLTFSNGLLSFGKKWNPPMMEAPVCLRSKMKEILILNQESVDWKEIPVIRYLLEHSYILEKLTIHERDIDPERRELLLNSRCSSKLCLVEFV